MYNIRKKFPKIILSLCCALLSIFHFSDLAAGKANIKFKNPLPMTQESIKLGEQIFMENCVGCHGRRADGRGRQALNLEPKPQNLRNAQFVKYLSDERIFSSISGGVQGTAMPTFEMALNQTKRWQVINYIRSLTAADKINLPNAIEHEFVPVEGFKNPVKSDRASVENGKKLFEKHCSVCHGKEADGQGKIADNLYPKPRNLVVITSWGAKPFMDYLSDPRTYDSITNGVPGTSMMPWIKVISQRERWDIINFLRARATEKISKIKY
jgi:mono/diheme cytochrome c family protein